MRESKISELIRQEKLVMLQITKALVKEGFYLMEGHRELTDISTHLRVIPYVPENHDRHIKALEDELQLL